MGNDGKIGPNGQGESGGCSSWTSNAGEVGLYSSGLKAKLRPRSHRSAFTGRRRAKTIGLLLVFAAAIVIVSGLAMAPNLKGKSPSQPGTPAETEQLPPYVVSGQVFESDGVTIVGDATVTLLNTITGVSGTQVTDPLYGYYEFNLNDVDPSWTRGDLIRVTAVKGTLSGSNEGIAGVGSTYGSIWLDIIVTDTGIPEFPMVVVPVVGMLAVVVAVNLRRERGSQ